MLSGLPPTKRPIPSFAAEPPRERTPSGRWAETLAERFRAAAAAIETDDELGVVGELDWFPDRTYGGRTFVPATAHTDLGIEIYGYVSFTREHDGAEALDLQATADYTAETAEDNPDWTLDLSDRPIGSWQWSDGTAGELTLIFGEALVADGAIATAEIDDATTDQCAVLEERFTLISVDGQGEDYVWVRLWAADGTILAAETLYEEEEEGEPEVDPE